MRLIHGFLLLLVLSSSMPALRGGEEGLKATFDAAVDALSRKDINGFLSHWHREAVLFTRSTTYPIDRAQLDDREWAKLFEDAFAQIISIGYTQKALKFRVLGETGMVWGMTRLAIDTRAGDGFDKETRLTAVFTRQQGAWKIIHWSSSPAPRGVSPIR